MLGSSLQRLLTASRRPVRVIERFSGTSAVDRSQRVRVRPRPPPSSPEVSLSPRASNQQPQPLNGGLLLKWLSPTDHCLALNILRTSSTTDKPSFVEGETHAANLFLLRLAKSNETGMVEKALAYVSTMRPHFQHVPSVATRVELITACGREVRRLLDPSGASSSVDVREEVRRWVARARGLADEVLSLPAGADGVGSSDVLPSPQLARTCDALIYVYCQAQMPHEARALYNQMLALDLRPDPRAAAGLVRLIANKADPREAVLMLEGMRKGREGMVEHFEGLYCDIVHAVADQLLTRPPSSKAKALRAAAKRAVASMRASGEEVTRPVWHALLLAEAVTGRTKEVRWLMSEMEGHGLELTAAEYGLLVDACGFRGALKELRVVVREMSRRGVLPDEAFHVKMIVACGRCKDLEGAQEAFAALDGVSQGSQVSRYSALMKVLRELGLKQEAWQLFQDFRAAHHPPDAAMVRVAIRLAAEVGDVQLMEQTYKDLAGSQEWRGHNVDFKVLNSLMAGYAQAGHWDKAWEVFERLKSPSREPMKMSSYNVMICALARANRLEEARTLGQEAKERGLKLDGVTIRALVERPQGSDGSCKPSVPVQGATRSALSGSRVILDLCDLGASQARAVLSSELQAIGKLIRNNKGIRDMLILTPPPRHHLNDGNDVPEGAMLDPQLSSPRGPGVRHAVRDYLRARKLHYFCPEWRPGGFVISGSGLNRLDTTT